MGMVVCVRRRAILGHSHTERYHVQNSDYLNRTDTLMYDEKHHHKGHMTSSYPTEKTPLMPDVVADFPTISRKNSEAEDFAVRVEGRVSKMALLKLRSFTGYTIKLHVALSCRLNCSYIVCRTFSETMYT